MLLVQSKKVRIQEIHSLVANNLELHWLIIKAMPTKNLDGLH